MLRHAWSRLIRKQWLIVYPFTLSVVGTLAFLAIYAAGGERLGWSPFFNTDFDRWSYVREQFVEDFSLTPDLLAPIFAGLAFCLFCALIQAPLFRAIAGRRYPLAPRDWPETARLFLYYLLVYVVTWVAPLPAPATGVTAILVYTVLQVFAIVVVFADYVIVFESVGVVTALRRSVRLVGLRLGAVLAVYVVLTLVLASIRSLYGLYYDGTDRVFALLPISQMLVESLVLLAGNLVLIFLYEDTRRRSPA